MHEIARNNEPQQSTVQSMQQSITSVLERETPGRRSSAIFFVRNHIVEIEELKQRGYTHRQIYEAIEQTIIGTNLHISESAYKSALLFVRKQRLSNGDAPIKNNYVKSRGIAKHLRGENPGRAVNVSRFVREHIEEIEYLRQLGYSRKQIHAAIEKIVNAKITLSAYYSAVNTYGSQVKKGVEKIFTDGISKTEKPIIDMLLQDRPEKNLNIFYFVREHIDEIASLKHRGYTHRQIWESIEKVTGLHILFGSYRCAFYKARRRKQDK